jgi:hypothetical protein
VIHGPKVAYERDDAWLTASLTTFRNGRSPQHPHHAQSQRKVLFLKTSLSEAQISSEVLTSPSYLESAKYYAYLDW